MEQLEAWMQLNPGRSPFTRAYDGDFVELVTRYYQGDIYVPNPDFDPSQPEDLDEKPRSINWSYLTDDDGNPLVEDVDGAARLYYETERDKLRWTFAPPVLVNEGHKLQRDWFFSFLKDPYQLRQQIRDLGGIPAFARGGTHRGGLARVGENDIELVAPSRIYNPADTKAMLDNREVVKELAELRSELAQMRAEQRSLGIQTVTNTKKTADRTRQVAANTQGAV